MAVRIAGVEPGSPAEQAGLRPDMLLCRIDGHEIRDGLDYEFYSARSEFEVMAECDGEAVAFEVRKDEYQPLGCQFSTYLIDKHHTCRNKCVFCFIDQMPKGMRPSLYFKDDDERLSFLFGNYVTLTNLSSQEVDRIIEMRIAPVNISIHTVNPELRVKMMGNRFAGEVLKYIPRLVRADIPINTQLVLCPGLNDGNELRRSIEWLASFRPALQSIAAVPVGVTRFREGLYPLRAYTKEEAAEQLAIMREYSDLFRAQTGLGLVYPSDEWFLLAGQPIPDESFYDGYPQLENGVGMWRLMENEFETALEDAMRDTVIREVDLATGKLAAPLLRKLAKKLHHKFPFTRLHVHAVENRFFGPGVTVAGLLTGADLIQGLRGRLQSGTLLLPDVMLRAEGDLLLDDTTVDELADSLGVHIEIVPVNGDALLNTILGQGSVQ